MKGTILDFLKLAAEKPELAKELVELASQHNFAFRDEVSDDELENVAGGTIAPLPTSQSAQSTAIDGLSSQVADIGSTINSLLALIQELQQPPPESSESPPPTKG